MAPLKKDEYLLSLRERQTMVHKEQRQAEQRVPQIGDVVLVKEIDLRREEWKLGRIEKITMRHGYIKAVTVFTKSHVC